MLTCAIFWSNLAGLSGGGIVVPVMLIVFKFPIKQAVFQSNASLAIGGILRYFVNSKKPHPLKNGKGVLVDYALASLMMPPLVIGAGLAVLINKLLPEVIIISCDATVLFIMLMVNIKEVLNVIAADKATAIERAKIKELELTAVNLGNDIVNTTPIYEEKSKISELS